MPLSTAERPERTQAMATIHAALDAGVRHIDTADAYCLTDADEGHNERLIAEALGAWTGDRGDVLVATKGGHVRDARGGWHTDGRPQHLRDAALRSRERLGVERIGLYYFHRPDPAVAFERSVEAVARLLDGGVIERVGISNVDTAQLLAALRITDVTAVQNEMSPFERASADVLDLCEERGIAFVAWAPLGGAARAGRLDADDVVRPFVGQARERRESVARAILRDTLGLSPSTIVIPGARRPSSIVDAVGAAST